MRKLCLCLCLCLWAFVAVCVKAGTKKEGDFRYRVMDGVYVSLVSYLGEDEAVVVPNEVEGKKVIKIGKDCFADDVTVTSVTVPDGVTYIDDGAFAGCANLEEVILPDSVSYIGYGVFNASGIRSFRIPKGIPSLDHILLEACPELREIVITDLKGLDEGEDNKMSNMCPKLRAYRVEGEDSPFFELDGVLFFRRKWKLTGFEGDERVILVAYPQGKKDKKYHMPNGVTDVADGAFRGCQYLQTLRLSTSVGKMQFELDSQKPLTVLVPGSTILKSPQYLDKDTYYATNRLSIVTAEGLISAKEFAEQYRIPYQEDRERVIRGEDDLESVEDLGHVDSIQAEDLDEFWESSEEMAMVNARPSLETAVEGALPEVEQSEKEGESSGGVKGGLAIYLGAIVLLAVVFTGLGVAVRKRMVGKEERNRRFSRDWTQGR